MMRQKVTLKREADPTPETRCPACQREHHDDCTLGGCDCFHRLPTVAAARARETETCAKKIRVRARRLGDLLDDQRILRYTHSQDPRCSDGSDLQPEIDDLRQQIKDLAGEL